MCLRGAPNHQWVSPCAKKMNSEDQVSYQEKCEKAAPLKMDHCLIWLRLERTESMKLARNTFQGARTVVQICATARRISVQLAWKS